MIHAGAVSSRAISCAYLNYCTTPNKYVQYGKQKIYISRAFLQSNNENGKQDNPSGAALFAVLRFVQLPKNNCASLIERLLPVDSCLFKKITEYARKQTRSLNAEKILCDKQKHCKKNARFRKQKYRRHCTEQFSPYRVFSAGP